MAARADSWLVLGKFRARKCMPKIKVLEAKIEANRVPKAHFLPKPLPDRKKEYPPNLKIAFFRIQVLASGIVSRHQEMI